MVQVQHFVVVVGVPEHLVDVLTDGNDFIVGDVGKHSLDVELERLLQERTIPNHINYRIDFIQTKKSSLGVVHIKFSWVESILA